MSTPLYEIPREPIAESLLINPDWGELKTPLLETLIEATTLEELGTADLKNGHPDRGEIRYLQAVELRRHAGAIIEQARKAA